MKEIDLSIIIPIYNGEKYIDRCIKSIIDNTKKIKYELILVNDCSKDSSLELMKKYENKYKNIKIIDLSKNKGVSYCRNKGISESSGKYIGFVDIDDYINNYMFDTLILCANEQNLDVCGCNYIEKNEKNSSFCNSKYKYDNSVFNKEETLRKFLIDEISPAIWDKIFKKELIQGKILFNENMQIGEDILFCLETFFYSKANMFINEYNYIYVQQNTSAMHSISEKLLQFLKLDDYINNKNKERLNENFFEEYEYFRNEMFIRAFHSISTITNRENRKQAIEYLNKIISKTEINKILKNKYTNKMIKIELTIVKFFGIKVHLRLMPFYKIVRKILRK